jgi:ribosomal subunit interface protein
MELILRNRNGNRISERQRGHIEEKLGKLTRFMDDINSVEVEVSTEHRQDRGEVHRMQATLVGDRGIILRADRSAGDLYSATDMVQEVLQRQIKRYKDKHWRRGRVRRKGDEFVAPEMMQEAAPLAATEEALEERHIVRIKEFALKPMFTDEAVEQMELLDHTFFVFRDAETSNISIVYRRHDGNYGMIVPVAE